MELLKQLWEDRGAFLGPLWEYLTDPFVWVVLIVGIGLIAFVRVRRNRRPIVLFRSQGGNVEMARATLRGLIIGATLKVRGVEAATCRYDQKGRKLRITVSIHLAGDARLTEVEDLLKQRIRGTLQQQVGYEPADVAPINVRVTKIVGDPALIVPEPTPTLLSENTAEDSYEQYVYQDDTSSEPSTEEPKA